MRLGLGGVQLLVEVQHLLLQGVEAPQAGLAFFLPQPLLLRLLQPLLLGLPQLQVENLQKGRSCYLSLWHPWAFSFYIPPSLTGPRTGRGRPKVSPVEARSGPGPLSRLAKSRLWSG